LRNNWPVAIKLRRKAVDGISIAPDGAFIGLISTHGSRAVGCFRAPLRGHSRRCDGEFLSLIFPRQNWTLACVSFEILNRKS
jgi:hypothetical protein